MNKGNQIKLLILELCSDGKKHSCEEINQYVLSRGIKLEPNTSLVRSALFSLKKTNVNFINVDHGEYQLQSISSNLSANQLIDAINIINRSLNSYNNFAWYRCDDAHLLTARNEISLLLNLAETINQKLK